MQYLSSKIFHIIRFIDICGETINTGEQYIA